jgi:hypothetical protein
MLSNTFGFRGRRGLALCLALACALSPASAADKGSSPEDRQRFVSVTRNLEAFPLKPEAKADRAWAVGWLAEAPDVSVTVCTDPLAGLVQSDYPYAAELTVQYMFAMGARIIEHPESANDPNAVQLAGVEGTLNAYRAILREKPEAKSPALDGLLQAQAKGELPDLTRKAFASCLAKS